MTDDERALVEALRAGDEDAFASLMDTYNGMLLRLARMYVTTPAVAEEVVQETWVGVIKGIDRFEGRSSFKTWLFRILTNIAKTRGQREARSIPFSSAAGSATEDDQAIDADRFLSRDHDRFPGHWALGPTPWEAPEESLLLGEARELILAEIENLPPNQRAVITLRDIDGWSSEEVRNELEVGETNQRVLLHRARARVRRALEDYFGATEPAL